MSGQSERQFEQIPVPPEHLDQGYFGPHNTFIPHLPVMHLKFEAMKHFRSLGIKFDESSDDVDYFDGAVLRLLPDNEIIGILRRHTYPGKQLGRVVEITYNPQREQELPPFVEKTLEILGLTQKQVTWTRTLLP